MLSPRFIVAAETVAYAMLGTGTGTIAGLALWALTMVWR